MSVVISGMRERKAFSAREFRDLQAIVPFVEVCARRHWGGLTPREAGIVPRRGLKTLPSMPSREHGRTRCVGRYNAARKGERHTMDSQPPKERMNNAVRICVLLNAGSGKRNVSVTNTIRDAMASDGLNAEIQIMKKGSDIVPGASRAMEDGFDIIVAAGGDGTISAVASALQGSNAAMGILPLGTFNYFARSLDIPTEIPAAVRLLSEGVSRPVRIATINDRVFLNNASLGAYPAILKTREDTYQRWGRSRVAAYWSVLATLIWLRRPLHLKITAGDKVMARRTPLVFAVNNVFQLNQIDLEGAAKIAAGQLALFVAPDNGRWGMLRSALSLALGKAQRNVDFDMIAGQHIRIEASNHARDIACDGERARMRPPYDLRVIEDALNVIVPQTRQDDTR
ncbi:MAG TPA: diacylglycerol kinase family protein [Roseovarius sp.]